MSIDALVEQYNRLSVEFQQGNLDNAQKMMEALKLPAASLPYPPGNVSTDEMRRRLVLGRMDS
jgi:hypothetical protein